MELKKQIDGTKVTISIIGRLDYTSAEDLDNEIESLTNVTELIIDMKDLELLSSSGLRTMLNASEMMDGKGSMKIINAKPEIKEIFEISGFTDFFSLMIFEERTISLILFWEITVRQEESIISESLL